MTRDGKQFFAMDLSQYKTKTCSRCGGDGKVLNHRKLGNALKRERSRLGVTATYIAKQLGITLSYVSHMECGRKCWTVQRITKYLNAIHKGQKQ